MFVAACFRRNFAQQASVFPMARKQQSSKPGETPRFEEAVARLEEIVRQLEEGDLGLGDSLARYEEGVKLLRQSYDLLQKAERRIELLAGVDADGNPVTRPMADDADLSLEEKGQRRGQRRSAEEG